MSTPGGGGEFAAFLHFGTDVQEPADLISSAVAQIEGSLGSLSSKLAGDLGGEGLTKLSDQARYARLAVLELQASLERLDATKNANFGLAGPLFPASSNNPAALKALTESTSGNLLQRQAGTSTIPLPGNQTLVPFEDGSVARVETSTGKLVESYATQAEAVSSLKAQFASYISILDASVGGEGRVSGAMASLTADMGVQTAASLRLTEAKRKELEANLALAEGIRAEKFERIGNGINAPVVTPEGVFSATSGTELKPTAVLVAEKRAAAAEVAAAQKEADAELAAQAKAAAAAKAEQARIDSAALKAQLAEDKASLKVDAAERKLAAQQALADGVRSGEFGQPRPGGPITTPAGVFSGSTGAPLLPLQLEAENQRAEKSALKAAEAERALAEAANVTPISKAFDEGLNAAKYVAAYAAVFALVKVVKDGIDQVKQFQEGLLSLDIALSSVGQSGAVAAGDLAGVAAAGGASPGEGLQLAARGVQAFRAEASVSPEAAKKVALDSTTSAIEAQVLAGGKLTDVQTQLIAASREFNLGAEGQTRVLDAATNAQRNFGGSIGEVLSGLSQVAGLGAEAGFTVEQLSNIIALITTSTGLTGASAAGDLKRIIGGAGSPAFQTALSQVGVDTNQSTSAELTDLGLKYANLTDKQKASIETTLGGRRSAEALIPVLQNATALIDANALSSTNAGAATEAFDRRQNTLQGTLRQVSGAFKELITELGQTGLGSGFGLLLETASPLLLALDGIVKAFNLIPAPIREASFAVGELIVLLKVAEALTGRDLSLGAGFLAKRAIPEGEAAAAGLGALGTVGPGAAPVSGAVAGEEIAAGGAAAGEGMAVGGATAAAELVGGASLAAGELAAGAAAAGLARGAGSVAGFIPGLAGAGEVGGAVAGAEVAGAGEAGLLAGAFGGLALTAGVLGVALGGVVLASKAAGLNSAENKGSAALNFNGGGTADAVRAQASIVASAEVDIREKSKGFTGAIADFLSGDTAGSTIRKLHSFGQELNREAEDLAPKPGSGTSVAGFSPFGPDGPGSVTELATGLKQLTAAGFTSAGTMNVLAKAIAGLTGAGENAALVANKPGFLGVGAGDRAPAVFADSLFGAEIPGSVKFKQAAVTAAGGRGAGVALPPVDAEVQLDQSFRANVRDTIIKDVGGKTVLSPADQAQIAKDVANGYGLSDPAAIKALRDFVLKALTDKAGVQAAPSTKIVDVQSLNAAIEAQIKDAAGSRSEASARGADSSELSALAASNLAALQKSVAEAKAVGVEPTQVVSQAIAVARKDLFDAFAAQIHQITAIDIIGKTPKQAAALQAEAANILTLANSGKVPAAELARSYSTLGEAQTSLTNGVLTTTAAVVASAADVLKQAQTDSALLLAQAARVDAVAANAIDSNPNAAIRAQNNGQAAALRSQAASSLAAAQAAYNAAANPTLLDPSAAAGIAQQAASAAAAKTAGDTAAQIAAAANAANVFPGAKLEQAAAAIRTAAANLAKERTKGTDSVAFYNALGALRAAQYAYAQDVLAQERLVRQLSVDLTNPLLTAREAVRSANAKLSSDLKKGAPIDVIDADKLTLRQAQNAAEQVAFQQNLDAVKNNVSLGKITQAQYIAYLDQQHEHLLKIAHRTYQQTQELNTVDQLLQTAANALAGQFNIGNIKLPTIYEVRRAVQSQAAGTSVDNSTVTVQINVNAGDTTSRAHAVDQLTAVVGVDATRTGTRRRSKP
jgi:hypothetical protein